MPDKKCPEGEFLWRLEPETDPAGCPRILVQSKSIAEWTGIGVKGWLADANPAIDLCSMLNIDSLEVGQRFRFRLRGNPSKVSNKKRLGLLKLEDQLQWIYRKGESQGFGPTNVLVSQEQMLRGRQNSGNEIRIFSVLYNGFLSVSDVEKFQATLETGVGRGKVFGLGLLSIAPLS